MSMRVRAVAVALAVAGGLGFAAAPAQASVSTSFCNTHAYTYVVKNYTRGAGAYPLRCGTSSWGFRHVTARWDAHFDAWIALTIARGADVSDVQGDGGSNIFAIFDGNCNELFRVIYNGGAYNGNGVRPQGVITAYYEGGPVSALAQAVASIPSPPSSGTRANCYVYQQI